MSHVLVVRSKQESPLQKEVPFPAWASLGTLKWMEMECLEEGTGSAEKCVPLEDLSSPSNPELETKLVLAFEMFPFEIEHEGNAERNPRLYEHQGDAERNPRLYHLVLPARLCQQSYHRELQVAVRAVQSAFFLTQHTLERILRNEKKDRSLVTIADEFLSLPMSLLAASYVLKGMHDFI